MDYAQQQRNPTKHLVGIGVVLLLHVVVIYALVNGLARKVVEVIKQPIETKIIEEVKPPPPPEIPLPPPPKFQAPPPPYIPPPEVQVATPPPQQTITVKSDAPPPEAPPPVAPRVVEAPPAPPPPLSASSSCTNYRAVLQDARDSMAAVAQKNGFNSAEVTVEFSVTANGQVKDINILRSSHRALNRVVTNAVGQFHCVTGGREARFTLPIAFKLED